MNAAQKKRPFAQLDYMSSNRGSTISKQISPGNECLTCICRKTDANLLKCMSCSLEIHHCLESKNNRRKDTTFECASCLNLAMDPIFQVHKTFLKTYFNFSNIFTSSNQVDFLFRMDYPDLEFPVEIRAIKAGQTTLGWPMIGSFYLNSQKEPFYELKPLLCNSNRKARKEDYITIPKEQLKKGKNILHFKMCCLDRERYQDRFKVEQKGLYFLAINSIHQLDRVQLVSETFRQRRTEKAESLRLMNPNKMNEVQLGENKVNLICPYTKSKIKVPIRGKYCTHYSCVCLDTMIAFHREMRVWSCPICDERLNEPYVDIFIYTILSDNNQNGGEVWVSPNGQYRWITSPQGIDLDDSDSEELTKNPDSIGPAPPEEVITSQLLSSERLEDALYKKMAEKKKTMQIVKMNMIESLKNRNKESQVKEVLPSPMREVGRSPMREVVCSPKKEAAKSIKKEPKQSLPRKLAQVKLLQCTQVNKKSYISREFFSKANRTQLAKRHQDAIKKSAILKSFFGELI